MNMTYVHTCTCNYRYFYVHMHNFIIPELYYVAQTEFSALQLTLFFYSIASCNNVRNNISLHHEKCTYYNIIRASFNVQHEWEITSPQFQSCE